MMMKSMLASFFCGFFLVKLASAIKNCQQPFGIKMCRERRQLITGCNQCTYFHHHLVCCILQDNSSSGGDRKCPDSVTQPGDIPSKTKCPVSSRIVHARSNKMTCVQDAEREAGRSTRKNEITNAESRIFLAPYNNRRRGQVYQLLLQNQTIHRYQMWNTYRMVAVAYNHVSQKIYIAITKPNNILAYLIDSKVTSLAKRRKKVFGMAIDQKRDQLFITTQSSRCPGIATVKEGVYKRIVGTEKRLSGIVVDPKHLVIFAGDRSAIYKITYSGIKTRLVERNGFGSLASWPHDGVVYYNSNGCLMSVDTGIGRKSAQRVIKLKDFGTSFRIAVDECNVYLASHDSILVIDKERKSISGTIDVSVVSNEILLCLIHEERIKE